MKKIISFLILIFTFLSIHAQDVTSFNFWFKDMLINTNCVDTNGDGTFDSDVDTNDNGFIEAEEAEQVTRLKLTNSNFSGTTGITVFVNLEYLDIRYCNGNCYPPNDYSFAPNLKELYMRDRYPIFSTISNIEVLDLDHANYGDSPFNLLPNLKKLVLERGNGSPDLSQNILLEELTIEGTGHYNISNLSVNTNLKKLTINRMPSFNTLWDLSNCNDLTYLDLFDCDFSELDLSNLPQLEYLELGANKFQNVDFSYLTNLEYLGLSAMNSSRLVQVNVSNNVNLKILDLERSFSDAGGAYNDALLSIDLTQNVNLEELYISDQTPELIGSLDLSQNLNLKTLHCSNNDLTNLDFIPESVNLVEFLSRDNNIDFYDFSQHTNLETLTLYNFAHADMSNCPNLNYLSIGTYIENASMNIKNGTSIDTYVSQGIVESFYACVDEFEIDAVREAYFNSITVDALCSILPAPGNRNTIEGINRYDSNMDGCNTGDYSFSNLRYSISNGTETITMYSNDGNNYSFDVQSGDYTYAPIIENPSYFNVSPTNATVNFPGTGDTFSQDFCISPNGVHQNLSISVIPITSARPGFESEYKIVYSNNGNTTTSGDITFTYDEDFMDFMSSSENPTPSPGLLSWTYSNLQPFETRNIFVTMALNTPTDSFPLNDGDLLTFEAVIDPVDSDETPQNNAMELIQTVINSYDPNDKTCLEGEFLDPEDIGKYIHYRIRFENVGTAEAVNINVVDDINPSYFDISTLTPIDASHNFVMRISENNRVEFFFENINLPFDDANNDGYIIFKIKTLNSLTLGDTIENFASIYFDFNYPIITNTAQTTITNDYDNDGVSNDVDTDPADPFVCQDADNDGCDDCSQTGADGSGGDPNNDGNDTDGDGICDTTDLDNDNDGVNDDVDTDPTDPFICQDADNDGCDDCSQTGADGSGGDPDNDGNDTDGDGICDTTDLDNDNDGVNDDVDTDPTNPFICQDADNDGCDDCSQTGADNSGGNPNNDGNDTDGDGICDTTDLDHDNDGVNDDVDTDPTNPFICQDADNDGCDDCSQTGADNSGGNPDNDGDDTDGDGICDTTDLDHDNDGVNDDVDTDPTNPFICQDADNDGCDDCSQTGADNSGGNPNNDGDDADGDGICDTSDSIDKDLLVYPNPVKDILHIVSKGLIQDITISDSSGRVVYFMELSSSTNEHILDFSNWIKGLYFIKTTTSNGAFIQKVVK